MVKAILYHIRNIILFMSILAIIIETVIFVFFYDKTKYKTALFISYIVFVIYVVIFSILSILGKNMNLSPIDENQHSSSWVQLIETTGWAIPIPDNPRDYIDYIMQYGQQGKDYFVIYPDKQPNITSSNKAENNNILWQYAYNYRYSVDLWDIKWGYIMFTTKRPVKDNRSLFLAIDGSSKGALSMSTKEDGYYDNEYLYSIRSIKAWWYTLNLLDYIINSKLIIWWYIGESWNGIEKITIVKKQ